MPARIHIPIPSHHQCQASQTTWLDDERRIEKNFDHNQTPNPLMLTDHYIYLLFPPFFSPPHPHIMLKLELGLDLIELWTLKCLDYARAIVGEVPERRLLFSPLFGSFFFHRENWLLFEFYGTFEFILLMTETKFRLLCSLRCMNMMAQGGNSNTFSIWSLEIELMRPEWSDEEEFWNFSPRLPSFAYILRGSLGMEWRKDAGKRSVKCGTRVFGERIMLSGWFRCEILWIKSYKKNWQTREFLKVARLSQVDIDIIQFFSVSVTYMQSVSNCQARLGLTCRAEKYIFIVGRQASNLMIYQFNKRFEIRIQMNIWGFRKII